MGASLRGQLFGRGWQGNDFAEDFDCVDEADDGGVHRQGLQTGALTRGTALAEEHDVAATGAKSVNGDDGVRARAELRGIGFVDQQRPEKQEFSTPHVFVFFGADDRTEVTGEEHGEKGLKVGKAEGLKPTGEVRQWRRSSLSVLQALSFSWQRRAWAE